MSPKRPKPQGNAKKPIAPAKPKKQKEDLPRQVDTQLSSTELHGKCRATKLRPDDRRRGQAKGAETKRAGHEEAEQESRDTLADAAGEARGLI